MSRGRASLTAILAAAILSLGAAPQTWRYPDGRAAEGVSENVSITDTGYILLAPGSKEMLPGEKKVTAPTFLWSVAMDLRGTVYFGGGTDAQVLRLDKKGSPEPFFDVDDLGVRALAADVAGNLYVATFPNGRIYRVTPEGKPEVYFEPEERYVWALATDAFDRLFAASGERGVLYAVTGRGEGRKFFDSDEPHITALATDPTGRLLAGSSGRGLLYRLDNEGRAEVVLDSRLDEISAVSVASDGTVYAAALSEPPPPRPRRPGDRKDELTIEVTPAGSDGILEEAAEQKQRLVIDLADLMSPSAEGRTTLASQVYRVMPGRTPSVLWSSTSERAYSLALDPGGHLLIGTGPAGRVYRVEPDGSVTLVRQFQATHVTSMAAAPDGKSYVLTSNPGRAYVLDAAPASSGRYLSPVRDAVSIAAWGTLRWEADVPAGTKIEISARSGNSPVPDETWSGWSSVPPDPSGSPVKAPQARYIQWRADLSRLKTEATPVLKRVILTYLPENQQPVVRSVAVSEPGSPKPGASIPSQGSESAREASEPQKDSAAGPRPLWLSWTSSDPDGDPLRHTISVRRSDESAWKNLASDVAASPFAIDPNALPEGSYVARVEADDSEVNGTPRRMTAEGKSESFVIDRTPPVIEIDKSSDGSKAGAVAFTVRDSRTAVARAEFSAEPDGPWTIVMPRDGIADSPVEAFTVEIPTPEAHRRIFLRAVDTAGNQTTLEVNLSRPR